MNLYEEFIECIQNSRENIRFENSECHHIKPRCLGGTWDDGYVYLTPAEHFKAHKLLFEENPDSVELMLAYHLMCIDGNHDTKPEEYELVRESYIEYQRTRMQTDLNPMKNPEFAKKKSLSMRGNQYASGYKHTEETKERLSEALTGREVSAETRAKISSLMKGNPSKLGLKDSPETLEKKRVSSLGNTRGIGNKSNTGRKFITDGTRNRTVLRDSVIPEGWSLGVTRKGRK